MRHKSQASEKFHILSVPSSSSSVEGLDSAADTFVAAADRGVIFASALLTSFESTELHPKAPRFGGGHCGQGASAAQSDESIKPTTIIQSVSRGSGL